MKLGFHKLRVNSTLSQELSPLEERLSSLGLFSLVWFSLVVLFCFVTKDSAALRYPVTGIGMGIVLSLAEVFVTGVFRMKHCAVCALCHRVYSGCGNLFGGIEGHSLCESQPS
jgi:hypothetical protein